MSVAGIAQSIIRKWVLWIPIIAAAVLLMPRSVRARIRGWLQRALHRGDTKTVATSFYMEALAVLRAQGMKRDHGQTPTEFAKSIASHPAGKPFLSLTRIYNEVRFGPPDIPFHRSEAAALLHSLRTTLKADN